MLPFPLARGVPRVDFACVAQEIPGADVFAVTDPDIEIRVDPGRGENSFHDRRSGVGFHCFARGERANFGIVLNSAVELAEEFASVPGVVFPGVFPVENHADGGSAALRFAIADRADAAMQILGCGHGVHAAVDEPDQIGNVVIAEEPEDFLAHPLQAPGSV